METLNEILKQIQSKSNILVHKSIIHDTVERCLKINEPCPFGCGKAHDVPNCEYNITSGRCTR